MTNHRSSWSLAGVRIGVPLAAAGVAGLWIGTWLPGVIVLVAALAVAAASFVPAGVAIVRARREAAEAGANDEPWTPTARTRPSDVFTVLVGIAVVALVVGGQSCRPKCQCVRTPCACAGGPSWSLAPP